MARFTTFSLAPLLFATAAAAATNSPAVVQVEPEVQPATAAASATASAPRRPTATHAIVLPAPPAAASTPAPASPTSRLGIRQQIGFARAVSALSDPASTTAALAWETVAGGARVAAISITSTEATALRAGLVLHAVPDNAIIRFYAPDNATVYELTGTEMLGTAAPDNTYWSPVIESATLVMEIELPAGVPTSAVRMALPQVSHLVTSAAKGFVMPKAAGACNIDATCHGGTWPENNAVARMIYTDAVGSWLCTGTLLADNDPATTIPYFLSANHCISTQAVASTLLTYWFYRSVACGNATPGPYQVLTTGATLLVARAATDTSLMRLNSPPPAGAVYAGWTFAPATIAAGYTGIHHPSGDLLKISFGAIIDYSICGEFSCSSEPEETATYYAVQWSSGVTEGGSSGSGLFRNSGRYLIGQLYGGYSSCAAPGGADFYGRFDVAYGTGGLGGWLGATSQKTLTVTKAGTGGGLVTSLPGGVNCGPSCAASFPTNTTVVLTATPAPGSTFAGWSSFPCSGTGTCTVSMSVARNMTATFTSTGAGATVLWYQSTPGDNIGQGQTGTLVAPTHPFAIIDDGPQTLIVRMNDALPYNNIWELKLSAPTGQTLAPGAYESAGRYTFNTHAAPGLELTSSGRNCNKLTGRFTILELVYNAGNLVSLAVNIEQRCEIVGPPLYAELRINSTVPLSTFEPNGATTPDAFALQAQSPVKAGAVVTSDAITVYGINVPVPISISGGTYSVNGGPFTSSSGTVQRLDRVVARMTTSSTAGATTQATLAIGDLAPVPFTVTTYAPGMALSGLYFQSAPGEYVGQGQTELFLAPRNIVTAFSPIGHGLDIDVYDAMARHWFLRIAGTSPLVPGTYLVSPPSISFIGDGRSCSVAPDIHLVVREFVFSAGVVQSFAADWEHHCQGNPALLVGEVRISSTIPFSALSSEPPPPVTPRAHDRDGDGDSDLLLRGPNGEIVSWLMNGTAITDATLLLGSSTYQATHVADLDGDGRADVLVQGASGELFAWLMNGSSITSSALLLGGGTGYSVDKVGDFNGDGRADLLLRHTDGTLAIWLMNGTSVSGSAIVLGAGSGFSPVLVGDFDGNGRSDIALQHTNGTVAIWLMNGTAIASSANVLGAGTGYVPTHAADANGDARADLLFRGPADELVLWLMNGTTITSSHLLSGGGTGYRVTHTGDFNNDGRADLLLKHTNGSIVLWLMDGSTLVSSTLMVGATPWMATHALDFNNDGRVDVLLKGPNGEIVQWQMNGATIQAAVLLLGTTTWGALPTP